MSPSSFSFKFSVPGDPDAAAIIGELARHAADYAQLDAKEAEAFSQQAETAALKAFKAGAATSLAVFAAANGTLTMTIGAESVSQPLS
jgi:hypothetical protein